MKNKQCTMMPIIHCDISGYLKNKFELTLK